MKTQKRMKRVWAATEPRRRHFQAPRNYSHRGSVTARAILSDALQRVRALQEQQIRHARSVFTIGDEPKVTLPRRAEDLLVVLRHKRGVSYATRGVTPQEVALLYDARYADAWHAAISLQRALNRTAPYHPEEPHAVAPTEAEQALREAAYTLEPEPIVTTRPSSSSHAPLPKRKQRQKRSFGWVTLTRV